MVVAVAAMVGLVGVLGVVFDRWSERVLCVLVCGGLLHVGLWYTNGGCVVGYGCGCVRFCCV